MEVNEARINEMRALVSSGDLDISDIRQQFRVTTGRDTTLNDEGILKAVAMTDDDDSDLLVKNILLVEDEAA